MNCRDVSVGFWSKRVSMCFQMVAAAPSAGTFCAPVVERKSPKRKMERMARSGERAFLILKKFRKMEIFGRMPVGG